MKSVAENFLKHGAALAVLVVLAVLYWNHNVLKSFPSPSPVGIDVYHYYQPAYLYTAESLSRGDIPLWNPYQLCGVPHLGVLQGAVFYPPVLMFALLSPHQAYSLYLMFHVVLGGFFILLLCRHLNLSWLASLAGAVTFMFCSNTVSKIFGPAFLANSVHLPLMFICVLKIFETGKIKWAVILSLAASLSLLAGWIQALVYSVYALSAFVIAFLARSWIKKPSDNLHVKRGLLLLVFSAALFFLITAAQTFPVVETGAQATRSFGGLSREMMTINNTAMYGFYRMVYDTCNSDGGYLPFYLYMGMLPLFLGGVALWHKRLRFFVLFFLGLSACALILSMGFQTPVFKLWLHMPFAKMFRAPFRFLFLHAQAVSLLCAIGLERFLELFESAKERNKRMLAGTAFVVAALTSILFFIWPVSETNQPAFIRILFAASRWRTYLLIVSLVVFVLAIIRRHGSATRHLLGAGCIGVILLDLFSPEYSYSYLPKEDPGLFEKHASVIEELRLRTERDNSRIFVVADFLDFSYSAKLGQMNKLFLINDYENMNPAIYNRYCNHMFGKTDRKSEEFFWGWFNLDDKLVHPELLDYMSTRYIWFSRVYLERGTETVTENYRRIKESCDLIYLDNMNMVFLNPRALPRAYVVGAARTASDETEALEILSSPTFLPREEVVLLESKAESKGSSRRATAESRVVIKSIKPEVVSITADMDGDGFLVLTDQYFPGWKAWVDDAPAKVYRANYLFRCVAVPAGQHEIVFRYEPVSYYLGAAFSSAGLLLAVVCLVFPRSRKSIPGRSISDIHR